MPEDPDKPGTGRGNYPGGWRSRKTFFFRAWARHHNMTVAEAQNDPAANGYYSNSWGRGRYTALEAWSMAGVIQPRKIQSDDGDVADSTGSADGYEYTDEYK